MAINIDIDCLISLAIAVIHRQNAAVLSEVRRRFHGDGAQYFMVMEHT
jgi:hypothetical protein